MASERRLGAAFAERDRILNGAGREQPMPNEATVYRCSACEEMFSSRQALAGHGNSAKHKARVASGEGSPVPPAAPPANGRELCCPTCSQPLAAAVRIVAETFATEGIDEELAAKLAARAYGQLRVPA